MMLMICRSVCGPSVKRENGAETALPPRARIGLAETVFLDFEGTS